MISERKIAANRLNGRKSRGPRSAAGKAIASRNALRHGLAAITYRKPASATEIERFAEALCGKDNAPALFEQALIIANQELVLRTISEQQLAIVERLREPSAIALAKGDISIALGEARFLKSQEAYDELASLREKLLEKYKDELPPAISPPILSKELTEMLPEIDELVPLHLLIFLQDRQADVASNAQHQSEGEISQIEEATGDRDEGAALEEAALDLVRLDRYERRARSRQKRAIRAFINLKLMKELQAHR